MKDHEVKALFKTTLEDFQLSRNERGEIRDLLDVIKGNEQKRALFRSMAFDEARVSLGKAEYGQTLSVVRDEFSRFIGAEDMEWVLGKTALTLWSFGQ